MLDQITPDKVQGQVRGFQGTRPVTPWRPNLVMYDWATIITKLMQGNTNYAVDMMYIEFENTGGTPSTPSYDRGDGIDYYTGLAGSGTRNFIRVPLAGVNITSTGTNFPGGNKMTFFGQTQGALGNNGITFSNAVNSIVVGAALVAAPVQADYTQDLIFSRFYFDVADQIPKLTTNQIGIEWSLTLQ